MRHLYFALIASFIVFGAWSAQAEESCGDGQFSPRIQAFLDALKREPGIAPTWFNHRLSEYPIFLVDAKERSNCAGFWLPIADGFQVRGVELFNSFKAKYYSYEPLIMNPPPGNRINDGTRVPEIQQELLAALKSSGRGFALIWIFGTQEPDAQNPIFQKLPSQIANSLRIASHESFHFFVQGDYGSQKKAWTQFGMADFRDEDLQRCYVGTPDVKEIHRREMKTLIDAFLASETSEAVQLLRDFIMLRISRRAIVPAFTYKSLGSGADVTMTCKEGEERKELHEGIPQFVGNALMLDLGLATPHQIAAEIELVTGHYLDQPLAAGERPIHSYYHSGSVEMLLLRRFYQGDFLALTREVARPDGRFSIVDALSKVTGDLQ